MKTILVLNTPNSRWLAWSLAVLGTFSILETPALIRGNQPATLSCVSRAWLGLEPRHRTYPVRLGVFYGLLVWLAVHITSGKFGVDIRLARDPLLYLDEEEE